jgi:prepilin-type N-terminal cleavage/methylation domain-containing protein
MKIRKTICKLPSLALIPLRKPRENGFTLVEVIVAMFILAVGILAVLSMQMDSHASLKRSRELTEAMVHAQDQAEKLRLLKYNGIATPPCGGSPVEVIDPNLREGKYRVSWKIRWAATATVDGKCVNEQLKEVEIKVTNTKLTPPKNYFLNILIGR